ncbi:MAG: hypothetical protein HY283_11555 [Nitrospirae bacterium]|nr:hypothetical protein [Nitrospirota bacterium]
MRLKKRKHHLKFISHAGLAGLSVLLVSCILNVQGDGPSGRHRPETEFEFHGATSVVSGGSHACAVMADRTVACWGDNRYGQLGNGTTASAESPVAVSSLSNVAALAAGEWHTCAVMKTGQVECWGANDQAQLANLSKRSSSTPLTTPVGPATQIAAGRSHTCARLINGAVVCWGDNRTSQTGVQRPSLARPSLPVVVPNITQAISVAAGEEHSCAVQEDGQLLCWGDNHFGQLGHGIQEHHSFPPLPVPIDGKARTVTAGRRHTCALLRDGTVECWGKGFEGQLGDGLGRDSLTPVRVLTAVSGGPEPLAQVRAITAGSQHTCALLENGKVYCWGSNHLGQLGRVQGQTATRAAFSGLTDVIAVSAGGWQTCAIRSSGTTTCFGGMKPYAPDETVEVPGPP